MKRSEAARYARWSAGVALFLAGVTFAVYLQRGWTRRVERKKAPPAAPVDVSRQSSGITFKKVEQNRTIFAVEASHSTEFKGQNANLLEDVKITVFGKTGERHDVIHTQSCRYAKDTSEIDCSGEVQIDLMSARDAEHVASNAAEARSRVTYVETRGVKLDRNSGLAYTDQSVRFVFPTGSGQAVGLQYNSEEGTLRLLKDVRLTLAQPAEGGVKKKPAQRESAQEVQITGASLEFNRETRFMKLKGPAVAETAAQRLTAGEFLLNFDAEFRAKKLVATSGSRRDRPTATSQGTGDKITLEADTLTADFLPQGSVTRLEAAGAVHGSRLSAKEHDEAHADSGSLELWPKVSQPKELNLRGSVVLETRATNAADGRVLQTSAFRLEFSGGQPGQASKPQKAETLAPGTLEWSDAPTEPGSQSAKTRLQADKLSLDLAADNRTRKLQASGDVRTERTLLGRPLQTVTAKNGEAQLLATGGWSEMSLSGDVKLKEGDRSGQADGAVLQRASQTAILTGHAVARDASTETRAPQITFVQTTGDIRAEGGVRSADFPAKKGAVELAPAPAIITADTLQGNSKTGRALYIGHARFWQGDSVLDADSIELLRPARTLNASGNVRAIFPRVPAKSPVTGAAAAKKPQLWHVSCGTLTYRDPDKFAHLEQNVVVQSAEQRVRASTMDLYFTRATQPGTSAPGPQQIARAVATGGVVVEDGARRAIAERGEYTAADDKFVMSGGNPTIYDGSAGTNTGRQLTFFLADDTIIVDAENGSRTLTKHRVQK